MVAVIGRVTKDTARRPAGCDVEQRDDLPSEDPVAVRAPAVEANGEPSRVREPAEVLHPHARWPRRVRAPARAAGRDAALLAFEGRPNVPRAMRPLALGHLHLLDALLVVANALGVGHRKQSDGVPSVHRVRAQRVSPRRAVVLVRAVPPCARIKRVNVPPGEFPASRGGHQQPPPAHVDSRQVDRNVRRAELVVGHVAQRRHTAATRRPRLHTLDAPAAALAQPHERAAVAVCRRCRLDRAGAGTCREAHAAEGAAALEPEGAALDGLLLERLPRRRARERAILTATEEHNSSAEAFCTIVEAACCARLEGGGGRTEVSTDAHARLPL
mmetsp:Transcript_26122/g.85491  ORF Transcript_26122/g.85491 Transcript_26122/m.85491 type:complete len:329 (-) Transcript_26122:621-1607(-)